MIAIVIGDYYAAPHPVTIKLLVYDGMSLREILGIAKTQGLRLGYGTVIIDGTTVGIDSIDTPVHPARGKNEVEIRFREQMPPQAFDLDSIL